MLRVVLLRIMTGRLRLGVPACRLERVGRDRLLRTRGFRIFFKDYKLLDLLKGIADPLAFLQSSVKVTSCLSGRIRCYSALVLNQERNCRRLEEIFRGCREIKEFTVNPRTGSILIVYNPEELARNDYLSRLERQLRAKYAKESR